MQPNRKVSYPPAPPWSRGDAERHEPDRLSPNDLVFVLALPPLAALFGLGCIVSGQPSRGWHMLVASTFTSLALAAILGSWMVLLQHHAADQRRDVDMTRMRVEQLTGKGAR